MKTLKLFLLAVAALGGVQSTFGQGTAFVYHGRLNDGTNPANGVYDLTFMLFDAGTAGNAVAAPLTNSAIGLTNGLFTSTLDFGASFPGAERWLEIGVRTNGANSFTIVQPRQQITPVPYAITASNISGTLPVSQLSGRLSSAQLGGSYSGPVAFSNPSNSFAGDGSGLTNVNAATLQGFTAKSFWKTTGNSGTSPTNGNFLGTTDNNPFELWVNNRRGFRLYPLSTNSVDVIGGYCCNSTGTGAVWAAAATIAGGGANSGQINLDGASLNFSELPNLAFADFATVGGGVGNQIGAEFQLPYAALQSKASTISGGWSNRIQTVSQNTSVAIGATIAGGIQNEMWNSDGIAAYGNTISGGANNKMWRYATYATIGGGKGNLVTYSSPFATIGGGASNSVDTSYGGTIAGGVQNYMSYPAWGGTIGGGANNSIAGFDVESVYATIAGGYSNSVQGGWQYATVSGGYLNRILMNPGSRLLSSATIAGGDDNTIQANAAGASISGGSFNTASGPYATVPGGSNNVAAANAFAAGSNAKAVNTGAFVWADYSTNSFSSISTNEFAARATGGVRFVTAVDGSGNPTAGAMLAPGATSWATISDRNAKKDFAPVDGESVLDKLSAVPVEQWHYKWEADDSTPHMGPMAQDFKHAFYPGRDDKSITTLEFDGVELAAIQGLNEKLKEKDARITELEQRLDRMEKVLSALGK
jgi:hypothetical protein